MNYTIDQIKQVLQKKGYLYFSNGNYNVNIIGIRNLSSGNVQNDLFDDELHLIYKIGDKQYNDIYPITTDPGLQILKNPMNTKGTAILVPNQYRGSHCLGYHGTKNAYEALVQCGLVTVYRDNNRDSVMDFVNPDTGYFGINIHKAGLDTVYVQNWSAGCQVFKKSTDFDKFLKVCKESAKLYGNKFTYTLLTTDDFK